MTPFWSGALVGLFVGLFLGVLLVALLRGGDCDAL